MESVVLPAVSHGFARFHLIPSLPCRLAKDLRWFQWSESHREVLRHLFRVRFGVGEDNQLQGCCQGSHGVLSRIGWGKNHPSGMLRREEEELAWHLSRGRCIKCHPPRWTCTGRPRIVMAFVAMSFATPHKPSCVRFSFSSHCRWKEGHTERRGHASGKWGGRYKDLSLIHISEPTRPY